MKLLSEKLSNNAVEFIDKKNAYDQESSRLRGLENRMNVLEQLMKNPFNNSKAAGACSTGAKL